MGVPLTRREREVLELLATGARNCDIASRLSIAPSTARNHVSSIYQKLHVQNRAEAVSVAYSSGMFVPFFLSSG